MSVHHVTKQIRTGQHIPDILDCLAQLSTNEVPTPPKTARALLDKLPDHVWSEKDFKWLDPVSKSGIFLREAAARLLDGLSDQIPEFEERREHIYRQMLWGTSTSEITGMISRRSLYYSRDASGPASVVQFDSPDGNLPFVYAPHSFPKKKDGTATGGCTICGAQIDLERGETRENYAYSFIHGTYPTEELADMKWDVVIGNPPYHLDDGGYGNSAAPIYQLFVEQAKALNPRYLSMIIPSRWFAGGKGLDAFRESMLSDNRIRTIDDFLTASDAFPGVGLKGGVCYFLWDRDNPGDCRVTTRYKDWPMSTMTRPLLEKGADVFIRFNEGLSILKKVMEAETGQTESVELPEDKRFERLVTSRKPFGLDTSAKGRAVREDGDLVLYRNGGKGYMARTEISTGKDLIDAWKIFIGYAAPGTGNKDTYPHRIIPTPFIGEPGSISSETYLAIGPFSTRTEAENALSYLTCRLPRLLVLLQKPSQHVTKKVYGFVPAQDWSRPWTDADLYERYGLTEEEIAFVEKIVRPMDQSGKSDD